MTDPWRDVDLLAGRYADASQQRLARIVVVAAVSLLISCPVHMAIYVAFELWSLVVLVLFTTICLAAAPVVLRMTGSPNAGIDTLMAAVVFNELLFIGVTGGTSSPLALWIPLAPLFTMLIRGPRAALLWTGLVLSAFAMMPLVSIQLLEGAAIDAVAVASALGIVGVQVAVAFSFVETHGRMQTELAELHADLIEISREAGKAEVANGVLHNVGNALTSLNISVEVLRARFPESTWQERVAGLLEGDGVPEKAGQIARYVRKAHAVDLEALASMSEELDRLAELSEHMSSILAVQQSIARFGNGAFTQALEPADLIDAVVAAATGHQRSERVRCDYSAVGVRMVDRSRVSQILVNLVKNALEASDAEPVVVRMAAKGQVMTVQVVDQGVGIEPHHMERIFEHGFTTKSDGHGFGLHHSFNAAREMGGVLAVASDGPGKGATFELTLPAPVPSAS